MIFFDQKQGIYKSTLIPLDHGFGTKQFGDGRNKKNSIKQTHSTNIQVISLESILPVEDCDGIITKEKNRELSVITADCVPIIFYDPVTNISGISHQGWKGTLRNMAQKMILEMIQLGSEIQHIKVAIGPAINECCYKVNSERAEQFKEKLGNTVITNRNNNNYINLLRVNYDQLISIGILSTHLDYFPFCTSCNTEQFWSFRRDEGILGEMYSFIK